MDTWLCPACLAPSAPGREACEACSAPLVLGERFVVVEPLAARRAARTLGGIDRTTGDSVIVKTLGLSGLADWKQLELFQRGVSVLRALSHPGLPRHLADGQLVRGGETIHYWVQERVPGRTLAEGLAQGQRWTEARAVALADAMLEILEYLQGHSPPILHRDIKPSNIMERPDGRFVLIDFDLVKDTLEPEGGETTALGTVGYAPLEQLMGRAVPASDLYGLGATLVALLSRKSPVDLLDEQAHRIELRPHVWVSDAFAGFLERLVDPRASGRPVDATAARTWLRGVGHGAPVGAPLVRAVEPAAAREPSLGEARRELLRVLSRRAAGAHALVRAEAHAPAIVAVGPESQGVVVLSTTLAEPHPAPGWILPARFALMVGAAVAVPAKGVVLGVLLLALWVVSGFAVRYPVVLSPGRALFKGGLGNTATPGRYWLRRYWGEAAHSIPLGAVHLDWRPAPTRLEQAELHVWLELALDLWVEPRTDDVGQFRALLTYGLWQEHPRGATKRLRAEVIDAVVEHLGQAGLLARAGQRPVPLEHDDDVRLALAEGLSELGLELRAVVARRAVLVPRSEALETEDRLWIDAVPPP